MKRITALAAALLLALSLLKERRSQIQHFALTQAGADSLGMACGGDVTVLFQFISPEDTLWRSVLETALAWLTAAQPGWLILRTDGSAPALLDRGEPCNLVARRDGLVLRVQALGGVPQVLKGMSVTEGQLLISGVEDTETVGARVLTGMGKVEARTWYTLSTVMPLTVAEKQYTGEEKQGYSLVFGTNRVKFFLNSSIGTGNYDKITERTQWSLFGLPLPVTFVKETFRFYETVPAEVSAAQAESQGEAILTDYLHTLVDPYGTVSSTLCTSRREGDGLLVTLTAECVEEIGRAVPIYTDPTEESGG